MAFVPTLHTVILNMIIYYDNILERDYPKTPTLLKYKISCHKKTESHPSIEVHQIE